MGCKRLHASLITLQIVFGARCALVCKHSTRFSWMLEIGTHPWSSHSILSWRLFSSKWAFLHSSHLHTWLEDILLHSSQPMLGIPLHQNNMNLQCKNSIIIHSTTLVVNAAPSLMLLARACCTRPHCTSTIRSCMPGFCNNRLI